MTPQQFLSFPSIHYFKLPFAILFFFFQFQYSGGRPLSHLQTSNDFVTTSCRSTLYPELCFASLSPYASTIQTSPVKLAHTALSVTLNSSIRASSALKNISFDTGMRPREVAAMSDCMENFRDSIDELRGSLAQMQHMGGRDLGFQLSNIQTWVSAALTNDDTCMDGFEGAETEGDVKEDVRKTVLTVAQLTSNALAFINCLAASSHGFP